MLRLKRSRNNSNLTRLIAFAGVLSSFYFINESSHAETPPLAAASESSEMEIEPASQETPLTDPNSTKSASENASKIAKDSPGADPSAAKDGSLSDPQDESLPGGQSKISQSINDADDSGSSFWANYYGVFYGPSVSNPTSYQATSDGIRDPNRPLLTKNYMTIGYNIDSHVALAATGWWNYVPVQGGDLITQDPSARLAYNDIVHTDNFNWYGDVRAYFPITNVSRQADLLAGFQSFHYFSYSVPDTRLTIGTYASVLYNYFGKQGSGDDLQLYLAPALSYRVSPKVSLTALYELSENHAFGADPFHMYNDGSVFEPGVEWAVTPAVFLNPYFYIYTQSVSNTGLGATLSWLVF